MHRCHDCDLNHSHFLGLGSVVIDSDSDIKSVLPSNSLGKSKERMFDIENIHVASAQGANLIRDELPFY
jgi:hypothetical protein